MLQHPAVKITTYHWSIYITGNYGACGFCVNTVRQMLPAGARLNVFWRSESGAIRNRTFIGLPD